MTPTDNAKEPIQAIYTEEEYKVTKQTHLWLEALHGGAPTFYSMVADALNNHFAEGADRILFEEWQPIYDKVTDFLEKYLLESIADAQNLDGRNTL